MVVAVDAGYHPGGVGDVDLAAVVEKVSLSIPVSEDGRLMMVATLMAQTLDAVEGAAGLQGLPSSPISATVARFARFAIAWPIEFNDMNRTLRTIAAGIGAFLITSAAVIADGSLPIPAEAAGKITIARAREHVEFLASDRMMGRNTPSRELDQAADYIAAQFRSYGLEPVHGGYFAKYALKRENLDLDSRLQVDSLSFTIKTDFVPCDVSGSGRVEGEAVFVGYGISRPAAGYDDYAGIDVRGKIVVAIAGEPRSLSGNKASWRSAFDAGPRAKMRAAAEHGAVGLLLVINPSVAKSPNPYPYYWPSLYPKLQVSTIPLKLDLPDSVQKLVPTASIGAAALKAIFGGSLEPAAQLARKIDSTGRSSSMWLGHRVMLDVRLDREPIAARNVVGMIRGRLHPDEYVVIGAHYDHIGYYSKRGFADDVRGLDTIYNGADDNASGTAGVMMMAEAFASLPPSARPARSVIFIAFSGEEKGLFGSRAFVAGESIPNEKIRAMINLDMIGRNNPDSVSFAGKSRSPELYALLEQANQSEPMTLANDLESFFFRSDQASFAAKKIPVLFLSTGEHEDYHQVSDSPDKIDYGKLAHVARLCFRTAWLAAESTDRFSYQEVETNDPNQMILDP